MWSSIQLIQKWGLVETHEKTWKYFLGDNIGETEDILGDNMYHTEYFLDDSIGDTEDFVGDNIVDTVDF